MVDLPPPWGDYLQLQVELGRSDCIDDRNWGLEAALNALVDGSSTTRMPSSDELVRARASAERRERHRALLRRKYGPTLAPEFDAITYLEARAQLRHVMSLVSPSDWQILCALAEGSSYDDLGVQISGANLRVRVYRLRKKINEAA